MKTSRKNAKKRLHKGKKIEAKKPLDVVGAPVATSASGTTSTPQGFVHHTDQTSPVVAHPTK